MSTKYYNYCYTDMIRRLGVAGVWSQYWNELRASLRYGSNTRRPARNWMCSSDESGACDKRRTVRTRDPVHYILFTEDIPVKPFRLSFYFLILKCSFLYISPHSASTHTRQVNGPRGICILCFFFFCPKHDPLVFY